MRHLAYLSLLAGCLTKETATPPTGSDTDTDTDTDADADVEILVDPSTLDLGTVFVGDVVATTLTVSSIGSGAADVTVAAAGWTADPSAQSIAPGSSADVALSFTPTSWGDASTTLVVTAPGAADVAVPVTLLVQEDADGDGFGSLESGGDDCDDTRPEARPGADDAWYDGFDANCDGADDYDQDVDGAPIPDDCADLDATVFPGAVEVWYDGVDQDCSGGSDHDQDLDGHDSPEDCADLDPAVFPGATEVWYDDVDQDCSGGSDHDQDGDGVDHPADCGDTDPLISPLLPEVWYDGVDGDCDGADDFDQDGDGTPSPADCLDTDPTVHPDALETWYDGVDGDCDGGDDYDQDLDGAPVPADCVDTDPTISPLLPEVWYDGVDQSCDGGDDYDQDGDGVAPPADCDDLRDDVYPGATDYWYDGTDSNCDGADDYDRDTDGVPEGEDCDDTDPAIGLPTPEVFDGLDNDCDGARDELPVSDLTVTELWGISSGWMLGAPSQVSFGGDLNDDGAEDLVVVSGENGNGYVWLLTASDLEGHYGEVGDIAYASFSNGFSPSIDHILGPSPDLTGDGVTDLVLNVHDSYDEDGEVWVEPGGPEMSGFQFLNAERDHVIGGDGNFDDIQWAKPADVDGDGLPDVIVGAHGDSRPGASSNSGSVTVFSGDRVRGTLDLDDADGYIAGTSYDDRLGYSLNAGDMNGDGYADPIAGAPWDDDGGTDAGAVYVVHGNSTFTWADDADTVSALKIVGVSGNKLGHPALATPGDNDGDGGLDLIVSDGDLYDEGAWLFLGGAHAGDSPLADADVTYSGSDGFGVAASNDTDLNGDDVDEVIVGANTETGAASYSGVAYVWYGREVWPEALAPGDSDLSILGDVASSNLGAGLIGGWDVTGDGREDLMVGAPYLDDAGSNSGTWYLIPGW